MRAARRGIAGGRCRLDAAGCCSGRQVVWGRGWQTGGSLRMKVSGMSIGLYC